MIRVLVVDDLELIVKKLQEIIAEADNINLVSFAHNKKEAIEQIRSNSPDVVILYLLTPNVDEIETTKAITQLFPEVKVLIVNSFEDDLITSQVLAVGANGLILKSALSGKLIKAINAVYYGSVYFSPKVISNLAVARLKGSSHSSANFLPSSTVTNVAKNSVAIKPRVSKTKSVKPRKPEKPLFPYADWIMVIFGVIALSRMDGMGHHLGHAGLFLLMLALIARSIRPWWGEPLKHRRAIGIFAFAATVAHAIYATFNVLKGDFGTIWSMSAQNQWGMWAGIVALSAMTPAAATSFQSIQRRLGKTWRQIHLLTVPALALAILHTVLVGPHYVADLPIDIIDHARTYGIITFGFIGLVLEKTLCLV